MKLLLIDGNNMCYRVFWTHKNLSHNGTPTGLIYGFLRSLVALKNTYPDRLFVIAWDSKSERRVNESKIAVEQGIVPSAYKANREENRNEDFDVMFEQMDMLKEALNMTKVIQVSKRGYEADDILYTYAIGNDDTVIVTSDHDYYQILRKDIVLYDAMKRETITEESFTNTYGIKPEQWVEVCAISGDKSDNIFGVSGWGEKTALKYYLEYGSLDGIKAGLSSKTELKKKEQDFLQSYDRIRVALSLKQMDKVDGLPELVISKEYNKEELKSYFIKMGFASLMLDSSKLVN